MKNLRSLFIVALAVVSAFTFNSCTTEDEPNPGPTLNFLGDAGFTAGDVTLPGGSSFKVGIVGSHDVKIDKMEIRVSYDGGTELVPANCTMCDSTINDKDVRVDFEGTTRTTPGTETWSFTLIDKDGLSTSKSIKITTTVAPKPIQFNDLTLGNQDNATLGSSYSLSSFLIYLLAEAKTNSELIDFIYVTDDADGEVLCAPTSSYATDILPSVGTWTTKNDTKLRKTTITAAQFDAMTDSGLMLQELANNSGASASVNNMNATDVYVVDPVSTGSRPALIKIVSVGSDNSIALKLALEKD